MHQSMWMADRPCRKLCLTRGLWSTYAMRLASALLLSLFTDTNVVSCVHEHLACNTCTVQISWKVNVTCGRPTSCLRLPIFLPTGTIRVIVCAAHRCHCGSPVVEFVRTCGHSEVCMRAERGPPAGCIYLSADLYCTCTYMYNHAWWAWSMGMAVIDNKNALFVMLLGHATQFCSH